MNLLIKCAIFSLCFITSAFGFGETKSLTVPEISSFGEVTSPKLQAERIHLLKNLRLSKLIDEDPTLEELFQASNEQIARKKLGFYILVHVSKDYRPWWNAARNSRLSSNVKSLDSNTKRHRFIRSASVWNVIEIMSYWGITQPMFFDSAIVLSAEAENARSL